MVGLNGLLSALVKPQRKADRDVNKSDSRERQIVERDAQRMCRPSGQLSWIDWLDGQVELLFALLRHEYTQLVGENTAFEPVSDMSGYFKPGFQVEGSQSESFCSAVLADQLIHSHELWRLTAK